MKAVISSEKYGYADITPWHKLLAAVAHNAPRSRDSKANGKGQSMGLPVSNYRVQNQGRN